MQEGAIEGGVGRHYRDMEWEGMAEEMHKLKTIGSGVEAPSVREEWEEENARLQTYRILAQEEATIWCAGWED